MPARSRMVVVANRLPVKRVGQGAKKSWEISPGGLVAAVHPILSESGGAWIGWAGGAGGDVEPFQHDGMTLHPIRMSKAELQAFYEGFSNATLWPLYHDALRTPEFRRRWWGPYVEINKRFAEAAAERVAKGGVVWVHDYQLQLVPAMVRALRPDVKIGYFLHIPFPAEELFARLPWRKEITEGLLGADLIGFQTRLVARNFSRSARGLTTARGTDTQLSYQGRHITIEDFPISIDVDLFEGIAGAEPTKEIAQNLRTQIGPTRRIILGVDRLDYTKGIDVRLKAIDEVLRRGRYTTNDIAFVQVAVPSREDVLAYEEMREQIERWVGRINGQYSEPGRAPVHYLRRNLSREDLVAYYSAADVMIVTPLRDGMNLVAKEYVAARLDNTGSLVLSEFAGAAQELRKSILVNPFDVDGVATAIETALDLSDVEQKRRMASLRRMIKRNTVFDWAERFLGAMGA